MSLDTTSTVGAPNQSVQQWIQQGEALYEAALREYHEIEAQIDDLETRLLAKRTEVNQIAQMIGKPQAEGNRRLSAELVSEKVVEERTPHTTTHIARALSGKFGR